MYSIIGRASNNYRPTQIVSSHCKNTIQIVDNKKIPPYEKNNFVHAHVTRRICSRAERGNELDQG